ncbi:hypothetical protein FOXG_20845 [Fusarium oxysporum f. sp. lycopersici 4287]|uniref:Uncharacterized protein n=2 Tax=Fusarium oxysporum TaxID=5507 RepID=A0A0J9WS35_FUSO4|nr:hypothetical protein FOXG_20845 [Fusarium oxysporum f. sp. lycopersici 4287]EXK27200.1 hypothetical protein FOMG_16269 [Fusarium oxysporum f. sp. melonis 26406]KNB13592.1 hypothetical protein FOXG_20845 [Fusarium oxysporum f. sp. lycopersici 4287]
MKLDRSQVASESLPDYNNDVEFPDNTSDVPGSPVSSIEVLQDAPTTSSLDLSAGSKQLRDDADKNLQQAQFAHSNASSTLAKLQGKQEEAFEAARYASEAYAKGLRDELDPHYYQTDDDRPPHKRRRSTTIDHAKRDHYVHLKETSQHCHNALISRSTFHKCSRCSSHRGHRKRKWSTASSPPQSHAFVFAAPILCRDLLTRAIPVRSYTKE